MELIKTIILLIVNFVISWSNASYCGRYWSESKREGGSFHMYLWCGYIQSIAGFTMVYGYIALLLAPSIMQMKGVDPEFIKYFEDLAANMLFIVVGFPIVSSGLFIWLRGLQITWENRTVRNIATSGWNSYAQIHNTVSYMREAPNALAKIIDAFSGSGKSKSSSKKKSNAAIVALILVVLAALSGYFTASAIMKKADREYDAYDIARKRAEE